MVIIILLLVMLAASSDMNVVYITFGDVPDYIQLNIELAARHNPVILVTDNIGYVLDRKPGPGALDSSPNVTYELVGEYDREGQTFKRLYQHLCFDHSKKRIEYEFNCFRRWFILRSLMKEKNLSAVFYGDGDSSVFTNIQAQYNMRSHCSAIVNVEAQANEFHWVAAGEASVWTFEGINDFCNFLINTYRRYVPTLQLKSKSSSVVDMSVLWLWWIQHTKDLPLGFGVGKPYKVFDIPINSPRHKQIQSHFDLAVKYARRINLPLGWQTGSRFSLNIEKGYRHNRTFMPSCYAPNSASGGRPESLIKDEILDLQNHPLQFINIHYIGRFKANLKYDVCRVLTMTGNKQIYDKAVEQLCEATLSTYTKEANGMYPCMEHETSSKSFICI